MTLAVQAEVWALSGDVELARRQIDQALATHRSLGDELEVTGDLRILARVMSEEGNTEEAERLLLEVIERAARENRPSTAAAANRDLEHLLARKNRTRDATEAARAARLMYSEFGASGEVRELDQLIASIT